MKILKKLSAKTVTGKTPKENRQRAEDANGKTVPIMLAIGVAIGTRSGISDFGEWISLRGNFSVTNLDTGEEFRGANLFLPGEITDMIGAQLADSNSVEFAVEIGIVENDSMIGFEYTVKPLIDTSENDPLANLMAKLPAPDKPKEENPPAGKKTAAKK